MKISIITICFNAATDLENTIASVRSQKYKDYEYIVVDGGSKDRTVEVINQNLDVITKWVSEPDKGIYDAMNKGIKMATGEWVIMMNAGDVFADSDVLQNVFAHVISDKITFLYGDTLYLFPDIESDHSPKCSSSKDHIGAQSLLPSPVSLVGNAIWIIN